MDFIHEFLNIKGDARAHDIHDVRMKRTRRNSVKSKFAILIDDRVSCIRAALEPDDYIRRLREHIRDLALSLIAPVCTDNCLYHSVPPAAPLRLNHCMFRCTF